MKGSDIQSCANIYSYISNNKASRAVLRLIKQFPPLSLKSEVENE